MNKFEDIVDSLNQLGITIEQEALENVVTNNLVEFSKLVSLLTNRLSTQLNLEETVNAIQSTGEDSTFYLEISSFLKELPCPYRSLTGGPINERFTHIDNKLDLLDFLTTELQTAQIISANNPQTIKQNNNTQKKNESEEKKAMKSILTTLGLSKPPANVTVKEIWAKIESQVMNSLASLPKDCLAKPLLNSKLTGQQWAQLMKINQTLSEDFLMRRELLMTRLDVTVQSFKWADHMKKNNNEITNLYQKYRKELPIKPTVKLFEILAARDDLLKQERTCSTRIMTKSHLHKILIPKPPDRGGRTNDLQAPPPEMPSFMKRRNTEKPQYQRPRGGNQRGGRGDQRYNNSNKWCNEDRRPQSDFERFQTMDYGNNQGYSQSNYQSRGRGGGGRGSGRGGRGRGQY